ncbi:histone methylation protein DOT1 [Ostertagia ostertagi]
MYVAGGTKVKKSVGIEINDLPAKYGAAMSEDFSKWMKWWKKKCRPFQLIHGDMLDEQFRNLITQEATIIFINNYAFEPSLDLHIKNMLADCHVGTRIISTKAYATGTKRVNMRNLGDDVTFFTAKKKRWRTLSFRFLVKQVGFTFAPQIAWHGPTTRNRWKVYVNQCEEKKKRGSPMPGSPRWNEADTDYVPPGLKKQRKSSSCWKLFTSQER